MPELDMGYREHPASAARRHGATKTSPEAVERNNHKRSLLMIGKTVEVCAKCGGSFPRRKEWVKEMFCSDACRFASKVERGTAASEANRRVFLSDKDRGEILKRQEAVRLANPRKCENPDCFKYFPRKTSSHRFCSVACSQAARKNLRSKLYSLVWKQGLACALCGEKLPREKKEVHIDHVIPLSEGGTNDEKNLRAVCATCHGGRRSRDYLFPENDAVERRFARTDLLPAWDSALV